MVSSVCVSSCQCAGGSAQAASPPSGQSNDQCRIAGAASLALLEALRGLPGVTHASLASAIPLGGQGAIFYSAEGMGEVDATNRPRAFLHRVSPDYVQTIGLRVMDGRAFAPTDLGANATNVMVTAALATAILAGSERDRPAHQER